MTAFVGMAPNRRRTDKPWHRRTTSARRGPFPKTNRSAFLNFLLAKYELYTGAVRVGSYPYFLTLEPSDSCQLRCPTCVTGIENEYNRAGGNGGLNFRGNRTKMSTALYERLLDEMGEYLFLLVFYNFGEPLLNQDLPQLIRKAKALGIETDINTNLSLRLSDERIEELLASGVDYICASIDGFTQQVYEVHRVGGDVELVKNNLARLVKARDRMGLNTSISYNMLVFGHNEHELPLAERFADELGVNFNARQAFVHDAAWLPSHRKGERPREVHRSVVVPRGFAEDLETGESVFREGEPIQEWSPLPPFDPSQPSRCSWHYGYSVVTAGGSVAPCCGVTRDEFDFGQVVPDRTSFADVWNNELFRKSRADFAGTPEAGLESVQSVCSQCPLSPFMHHLYSLHDFKVMAQFQQVLKGSDPRLDRAFEPPQSGPLWNPDRHADQARPAPAPATDARAADPGADGGVRRAHRERAGGRARSGSTSFRRVGYFVRMHTRNPNQRGRVPRDQQRRRAS